MSRLVAVVAALLTCALLMPGRRPVTGRSRLPAARPDVDGLGGVLGRVCALLRAGLTPAQAWSRVLGRPVGAVPRASDLVRSRRTTARPRWTGQDGIADVHGRALAVVAAARLSIELGAPLAAMLDQVADGVTRDEEEAADRAAALAGPRSSARILGWLPLGGLVLGTAWGADPIGAALGGGLGTAATVSGALLVVLGRAWTRRLVVRTANVRT